MRRFAVTLAVATTLLAREASRVDAAGPPLPEPRNGAISTQLIPSPAREARGAIWDSLRMREVRKEWAASESLATVTLRALENEPRPDSMAISRALFYFAHARLYRRLHAGGAGVEALERGIGIRKRHAIPNDSLLIWAHIVASTFFGEAGHPNRAVELGERGLHMVEAIAPTDTSVLAEAHRSLATSLTAVGRDAEAMQHFERALFFRVRADTGESRQVFPILADYGTLLSRAGELDRARAMLQQALSIVDRLSVRTLGYVTCLGRLSSFERRVGNLSESIDLAWRAYETSRQIDPAGVGTLRARTTLAYRLQDFGDWEGSAAHLREIIPEFVAKLGPSHSQTLNAHLALVQALVAIGDTAAAANELAKVRPALAKQDLRTGNNLIYTMQLAADLEGLRGRHAAARETLQAAVAVEAARREPFGAHQAELLEHLFDNVRTAADREALAEAGQVADTLADSTLVRATPEWEQTVLARARAESRAGLVDLAWSRALEAERLARERVTLQLEALPDLRGLQLAQQFGQPCELLTALAGAGEESRRADAWDRIVRWRGLVKHEIERRRSPVTASMDTAVAGAHQRWVAAQRRLAQGMVSGAAHRDDPATAARYQRAKLEAEEAERAFVRAARGSVPLDSVATLERVLARLGPDQALAAFALASDGSAEPTLGAFVAEGRDRRPRWVALGPAAAIESEVRAWTARLAVPPAGLGRAEERECRRLGARVRERVWDPIRRAAGEATEWILIPEGALTELPWLALTGEDGAYLAESEVAIRLLGAERDLLAKPEHAPMGTGLLAAGGPDFAPRGGPLLASAASAPSAWRSPPSACVSIGSLALPPLPAARDEAERIGETWPPSAGEVRVLVGSEATEEAVKQSAPGKAVIHLATHGVVIGGACQPRAAAGTRGVGGVDPLTGPRRPKRAPAGVAAESRPASGNPWLARQVWLALAGANGAASAIDENEGLLTAEETVTLDLRGTDWVVLSACHSGAGEQWTREGVLGMRRAFQLAGASAVIASQWAVGDQAASEWMGALYAARARGAAAGAAVREAARSVLAARRASGRSTHPFHWAAFSAWED